MPIVAVQMSLWHFSSWMFRRFRRAPVFSALPTLIVPVTVAVSLPSLVFVLTSSLLKLNANKFKVAYFVPLFCFDRGPWRVIGGIRGIPPPLLVSFSVFVPFFFWSVLIGGFSPMFPSSALLLRSICSLVFFFFLVDMLSQVFFHAFLYTFQLLEFIFCFQNLLLLLAEFLLLLGDQLLRLRS